MVKSKARTHFRQYIRNKPTQWGFKYWDVADPTGYTLDVDLYCGKQRTVPLSSHGVSYDVTMERTKPFRFQAYLVFLDNFYTTSPDLAAPLKEHAIGTLKTTRQGIPDKVKTLAQALNRSDVPRGIGYYVYA